MADHSSFRGDLEIQKREDGFGGNLTVAGAVTASDFVGLRNEAVVTGDGIKTRFVIRHGLGVATPFVSIYDANGERVYASVVCLADESIALEFAEPPSINESYRVVCIK